MLENDKSELIQFLVSGDPSDVVNVGRAQGAIQKIDWFLDMRYDPADEPE